MKIELKPTKIRDVYEGYLDSGLEGVVGYDGNLDIRPPFQREFIYKTSQRNEVINSVRNNFPLNVFYWSKTGDDTYEMLDGQQRTISICQYINNEYSIDYQYFHNLIEEEREQILNYELIVYVCEGTESQKLEWFKIINIAGEELTDQELRNAIYAGSWLENAKRYFSKPQGPAEDIADGYMSGQALRQDYLEKVLKWISSANNEEIEDYMAKHQHDKNANELWRYFMSVMTWVKTLFDDYKRKEMRTIDWGLLYNEYHQNNYDAEEFEQVVKELMMDDDVSKKSGIYYYLFDNSEKHLNIRAFTPAMKRGAYERQNGICINCKEHFEIEEMEADHITPWSEGGKTNIDNCQMLCKECNRRKGAI